MAISVYKWLVSGLLVVYEWLISGLLVAYWWFISGLLVAWTTTSQPLIGSNSQASINGHLKMVSGELVGEGLQTRF